MEKTIKNKIKTLPVSIFIILPIIIDQLNGFFISTVNINLPLSQLLKIGYVIIMMLYISKYNFTNFMFLFGLFIIYFLSIINISLYNSSYISMGTNISFILKVLYFPISILFFYTFIKLNKLLFTKEYLQQIYLYLFVILFSSLILSVLGFGNSMYSNGLGHKGYFIAGNELTALFLVLFGSILAFSSNKNKFSFLLIFMGFIMSILLGTKGAIGGYFIITLIFIMYMLISNIKLNSLIITIIIILIISMFMFTLLETVFSASIDEYINRWSFFLSKAESIFSFLVSGRDQRWENAFHFFNSMDNIFILLFGSGYVFYQYKISDDGTPLSLEMDPLDLFFSVGLLGTLTIYIFWFYLLNKLMVKFFRDTSKTNLLITTMFFTIIGLSIFAGHVIFSPMSTFYLAFCISFILIQKRSFYE